MRQGGTAGGSARTKAERYRNAAQRWDQGARGEELTAAALAPLAAKGYCVFHDLAIPGSRANVDHLVIGPTGAFAVDSKHFSAKLQFNKDTLWLGRYPQTSKLGTSKWEADQAAAVLELDVIAVQCIHGTAVPAMPGAVEGVHVVDAADLRTLIEGAPLALNHDQLAATLGRAIATWGPPNATVVSAPAPASLPPAPRALPLRTRRRAASPQRRRRTSRGRSPLAELFSSLLALGLLWVGVTKVLPSMLAASTTRPTVTGTVTCPTPGQGWLFALAWPGDRTGGYSVEWRVGTTPPTATPWIDKTQPRFEQRVPPGQTIRVRVRPAQAAALPSTERPFAAPATPC